MGMGTKIEWAHATWNPWIGCTAISPGCANCYAEAQDQRYHWTQQGWGPGKPRRRTGAGTWANLRKWNHQNVKAGIRQRVFVNSLSDFFDTDVPEQWRTEATAVMRECTSFDFLMVTKRLNDLCAAWCAKAMGDGLRFALLASVENQEWAEKRVPALLEIPATWHGVSAEPLLGPVNLSPWLGARFLSDEVNAGFHGVTGEPMHPGAKMPHRLDWVIVGGESHHRPMLARTFDPAWGYVLAEQSKAAGAAYFFKQRGSAVAGPHVDTHGPVHNSDKGQDRTHWEPWMVQQFPAGMAITEGETNFAAQA